MTRSRPFPATVWPALLAALVVIGTLAACTSPAPELIPTAATTVDTAQPGSAGLDLTAPAAPVSASAATATARLAARLPVLDRIIGQEGTEPGDLLLPLDVAVDADGNLYVTDTTGVQELAADGQFVRRIGGDVLKTALGGLALSPGGRLYVTGFGPQVWIFRTTDGAADGTLGGPDSGGGALVEPVDVAFDAAGNVYVADAGQATIEKFAPDGTHLLTFGGRGDGAGKFTTPRSVAVDAEGRIYVGLGDDFLIQRFAPDGSYLDAFGSAYADESASRIGGVAVDAAGNVYATQALSARVQCFTAPGLALGWEMGTVGAGEDGLVSPLGLTVAGDHLIVVDQGNHRLKRYTLQP